MSEENLELDHVLLAVADLEAAAREIEARYGLTSVEGGRHPGWGTANRIVPLGETYLELVTVIDEAEAAQSPFGSWVADAHPALARPLGWAVRTDALDDVARRLGLAVRASRGPLKAANSYGGGLPVSSRPSPSPRSPSSSSGGRGRPCQASTQPPTRPAPVKITKLQLSGDEDRVAAWLGTHHLPIEVRPGTPALASITLTGPTNEILIGAGHL